MSSNWSGKNNPKYKHGLRYTKLNRVFHGMHNRCRNESHIMYDRYGGRGISVCEDWTDFLPFNDWAITSGYEEGLQLDRINNDSEYSPDNCRWVTRTTNIRNSSRTALDINKVATIKQLLQSSNLTQKEIGKMYGIGQTAISCIKLGKTWGDVAPKSVLP